MQLDPAAIRTGVRLEAHAMLESTNETALARARGGERGPLWITALRQTAGRGRHGRTWVSEPGNLYATLLLTDPAQPPRAAELSFVAGLAVHDAILGLAPTLRSGVAIKWPNDILIDGKKCAGILIEGESMPGRPAAVAVGIGVNCAHHPEGLAFPATDLAAHGLSIAPQELFRALSRTMSERLTEWARGDDFAAIRSDWLRRAAGIGGDLRVVVGDEAREGRFETLDGAGRLVLRQSDGTIATISAGDVFPLASADLVPGDALAGEAKGMGR
jgi:BirA family biotin operon repressor/biotin-[acetyl-CoA-carboxylase] ligase